MDAQIKNQNATAGDKPIAGADMDRLQGEIGAYVDSRNDAKTRGFITRMPINEFLELTTRDNAMEDKIKAEAPKYSAQKFDNPETLLPNLTVYPSEGKIVDHEGRHRAAALLAEGAKDMPVVIKTINSYEVMDDLRLKGQFGRGEYEVTGLAALKPGNEIAALAAANTAKARDQEVLPQSPRTEKAPTTNQVESDEIFTARQPDLKSIVPPEVEKKYIRVGERFYSPNNTEQVAFEDKGNKLETKSNSENVAESMVRIAEARGWDEIKVSGTETFRKEVWIEAASRGMQVKGYIPTEQDKAELANRTRQADTTVEKENKPFRARENEGRESTLDQRRANSFANETPADSAKRYPELAGAAAVHAATSKQAVADGLTPDQRAIVSARVHQNLVNSIERGELPEVKIKDEVEVKQERIEEREHAR